MKPGRPPETQYAPAGQIGTTITKGEINEHIRRLRVKVVSLRRSEAQGADHNPDLEIFQRLIYYWEQLKDNLYGKSLSDDGTVRHHNGRKVY